MKKIFILISIFLLGFSISSCTNRQRLLFLNWGEYIDETLLEAFEEKYNCNVVMDLGESNEIFYSKVRGGTTVYDVVCPSDYMVEKMYANDMLAEIDFSLIPSYSKDNVLNGVKLIASQMENNYENISNYYVPYLWGTWGIMYSTLIDGLEAAVCNNENEWECLYNRDILPENTKVAMYDSHQHAYYTACKYLGIDSKIELNDEDLNKIYSCVKNMKFDAWGTDSIKKDIVAKNIDLGFMWTGDFLYYYCENAANTVIDAYLNKDIDIFKFEEMVNAITSDERIYIANGNEYQIGFDIYIPNDTIAFCDNLVITKDASNYELAHKFIDFMCSNSVSLEQEEINPSYMNTYYVCYNTPFKSTYDEIVELKNDFNNDDIILFNSEVNNNIDPYESSLFYKVYDYAIAIAFEKYYQKDLQIGNILQSFDRKYVNIINKTFNNARV